MSESIRWTERDRETQRERVTDEMTGRVKQQHTGCLLQSALTDTNSRGAGSTQKHTENTQQNINDKFRSYILTFFSCFLQFYLGNCFKKNVLYVTAKNKAYNKNTL